MSNSPLRQNLRYCIYDGFAATPISFILQPGNFIVAALLVERFHLPPATYGLIASLPFWGNFAQAFLMPMVNRLYSPKAVSVASSFLQALCWCAMTAMLSFLPENRPELSGPWFVTLFALSAAVTSLTGVSWMSWVQEWVPVRVRGRYFGLRNRLIQFSQITFLLLAGWLLDKLAGTVVAFQIVLGSAALLRLVSVWFQRSIHAETRVTERSEIRLSWIDQARLLFSIKPFLWLVAYGAAWGLSTSTFGPFYAVFMYSELGLSVRDVSFLVIIAAGGGALSAPAWGALADRFGNKPVILFCMIAWQLQNYLWFTLTPANTWMLYPMWLWGGVMGAGFVLGMFNLQMKIIPYHAKTLAISGNLAITSLITALGPIIGGGVLQHFLSTVDSSLSVYHGVFLVLPSSALLSCLLLIRVHERSSSSLSSVVGAMRNIRTLASILGLGLLMDYVFIKPQRPRKPSDKTS